MMTKVMNIVQKILLLVLYSLLVLMIVFSLLAIKDKGQAGYDKCIQKKCDAKGQEFCSKYREIDNCCKGAGGKVAVSDGKVICIFN